MRNEDHGLKKTKLVVGLKKTKLLNKINKNIKNDIKKSLPSKKKLREAEKLPPAERKRFLKKLAISFAKGAAASAGVALTIGVTYKLSKKSIHNEIRSAIKTASDETELNIQKKIPGLSDQLRSEIGTTIKQVEPVIQDNVRTAVDTASSQIVKKINEPEFKTTVSNVAGSVVREAQENLEGPIRWLVGPKKQIQKGNPENKNKNLKKEVDTENIIQGDTPGTLTRSGHKRRKEINVESHPLTILEKLSTKNSPTGIEEVEFGKYIKKNKILSKINMDKLKRKCKRLNIRLTVKRGSKRVYKSERVLIKQIRRKMRHFGESKSADTRSFYQKHKKKLKIAGAVALGLAVLGGAHYAATSTERGKATFTGYNKRVGSGGTWRPGTPKTPTEKLQIAITEKELNKQIRDKEDKRLLDDIQQANSSNNISEKRALEDRAEQLKKNRFEEDRRTKEEEERLEKEKKLNDAERLFSAENMQRVLFAAVLPPEKRGQILSQDLMTGTMQGMMIDLVKPLVQAKIAEMLEGDKSIEELQTEYAKEQDPEKKQEIQEKINNLEQKKKNNLEDVQEIAVLSEKVKEINEKLAIENDKEPKDPKKISKLNLKLNELGKKQIQSDIKELEEANEKEDNEENKEEIKKLEQKLEKYERARLEIIEKSGETTKNNPDNEFGKRNARKRNALRRVYRDAHKRKKSVKKHLNILQKDLKKLKNF
jgi:hypothetical protein